MSSASGDCTLPIRREGLCIADCVPDTQDACVHSGRIVALFGILNLHEEIGRRGRAAVLKLLYQQIDGPAFSIASAEKEGGGRDSDGKCRANYCYDKIEKEETYIRSVLADGRTKSAPPLRPSLSAKVCRKRAGSTSEFSAS